MNLFRFTSMALISCFLVGLGCSGDDEPGPAPTATIGIDATAKEIVSKALLSYEQAESGHVVIEMTLEAQGSIIKIQQELLFDAETSYAETQTLGSRARILQRHGAACLKEGSAEWRREPRLDSDDSIRTGGGILADLNAFSFNQIERLPDSRTDDGREAFVLKAWLNAADLYLLSGQLKDQLGAAGLNMTIESAVIEVLVEKDSLQVRDIHFDYVYDLDSNPFTMKMDMKLDQVNQTVEFPSDLPELCPGAST